MVRTVAFVGVCKRVHNHGVCRLMAAHVISRLSRDIRYTVKVMYGRIGGLARAHI